MGKHQRSFLSFGPFPVIARVGLKCLVEYKDLILFCEFVFQLSRWHIISTNSLKSLASSMNYQASSVLVEVVLITYILTTVRTIHYSIQ